MTNGAAPDTSEGNRMIQLAEFERLLTRASRHPSPEERVLVALEPNRAIVFKDHGKYKCDKVCGLANMARRIGKKRGLLVSIKHLIDGRAAVALYAEGSPVPK